jgi:hypothetical protein
MRACVCVFVCVFVCVIVFSWLLCVSVCDGGILRISVAVVNYVWRWIDRWYARSRYRVQASQISFQFTSLKWMPTHDDPAGQGTPPPRAIRFAFRFYTCPQTISEPLQLRVVRARPACRCCCCAQVAHRVTRIRIGAG